MYLDEGREVRLNAPEPLHIRQGQCRPAQAGLWIQLGPASFAIVLLVVRPSTCWRRVLTAVPGEFHLPALP